MAYTTLINHLKIKNNSAFQIFTKNGPLAFLPLSETQTSVVFSNDTEKNYQQSIQSFIEKHNLKYKIKNFSEIEI